MFDFEKIQPGSWGFVSTNMRIDANSNDDIVKNPIFVISKERYGAESKLMLLDQKLNLLIWNEELGSSSKFGTIFGSLNLGNHSQFYQSKVVNFITIKIDDIDQDLLDNCSRIMKKAEEIKNQFLKKQPEMKVNFFD